MPSPSSSSSATNVSLTYTQNIDALLWGTKWWGVAGTGTILSYSFPWASGGSATFSGYNGGNYSSLNEQNATSHYALNTMQQVAARAALQSWADVADINFQEVADTAANVGDIRFAWTSATEMTSTGLSAWGWAGYPNSYWPSGGDVWISTPASGATDTDWSVGSYNYDSLIHEIGHALGLKHPFEAETLVSTLLPTLLDTRQYSVMSYTDPPNDLFRTITYTATGFTSFNEHVPCQTPMVLDIAAIQYLYGANMTYHTGDDVYSFDTATPFFKTIWDAGGNDTISVSNFTENCRIDLTPGNYSSIRILSAPLQAGYYFTSAGTAPTYDGTNNLGIAYGAIIENAIGGSGSDTLTGNDADNTLEGGAGNDTLYGGAGNDKLDWDSARRGGTDIFYGGTGDDEYVLDNANDSVIEYAGEGIDAIYSDSYSLVNLPNVENLTAFSNSTGVSFTGNSAINTLRGSAENDTLDGGANFDFLHGGLGNDTYIVDNASDITTETSTLTTEIDTVKSSVSRTLGANLENLTLTGTAAINGTGNTLNNTLTGNAAGNILDGGAGIDTLIGGLGNDTYIVDNASDITTETSTLTTEIDTVQSSVSYTLGTNLEKLTLTGTAAINGTGNTLSNTLTGNAANNSLDGGSGNDTIYGGAGNDTFDWNASSRAGNDVFYGGSGDDIYVLDSVNDSVVEYAGEGIDTIYSDSYSLINLPNVEDLIAFSDSTGVNFTGNSASNWFRGASGNDTIDGGAGNDYMVYSGNRASHIITAAASGYLITSASDGADTLTNVEYVVFSDQTITLSTIDTTAPAVLTFSPADAATGVAVAGNIIVTFSEAIQRGTGSIVLKNAAGTTIETFDAATSSLLSISGTTLTINPTSSLAYSTSHFVTFASGTVKDLAGNAYTGTTTYDFTTMADPFIGTTGSNTLTGGAGNDTLDGGTGIDTASYTGNRANFIVTASGTGFTVADTTGANGTDTLSNVERISFADGSLGLDISGTSGQMYRLYKAAFNRIPDEVGLGWNIGLVDGGLTLAQMSAAFVASAEFSSTYGSLTNTQFLDQLYLNVLGRPADAVGAAWNLNLLDTNAVDRPGMLAAYSESAENQAAVIGQIQDGIWFT